MPYDLFSPDFKADPFPTYAEMRRDCPVYPHHAPYGAKIWYITRYEDVETVLKDTGRFVKNPVNAGAAAEKPGKGKQLFRNINQNMLFSDGADHARLRKLVNIAFTPKRVEGLRPLIDRITHQLLDQWQTAGEIDLMAAFAFPLPITVIMEMLGIPGTDREKVHGWSKAIIAPGRYGITLKERKHRVRAFVQYLETLFLARRREPQDDLITALVLAEADGDRLTLQELSSMVALLFVTGHETVVNLIGNGALLLIERPELAAQIRADYTLIPGVIEEMLRFDGPVETSTTRWAAVDCHIGGQQIRRGDVVRVVLTSANRDEAVFNEPDHFQIGRRSERPHLGFGLGPHYCLGAPLARLEGEIAIEALLRRFCKIELTIPSRQLEWHSGVIFRGLKRLPIGVTPTN